MDVEEVKIFCEKLARECIKAEKSLVGYMREEPYPWPPYHKKLLSIANDFNKIHLKLHQIKEGDYEYQENGLKN
jgi:hypothetical protein